MRIMGIESGLSNFSYRLDSRHRFASRESRLTLQNTVKMRWCRLLGGPAGDRCSQLFSPRNGFSLDVCVVASDRQTTEKNGLNLAGVFSDLGFLGVIKTRVGKNTTLQK